MALEGYKSNKNVVCSSIYHCVCTPKYRRSVLVGPIAKRCEQVIRQTAEKYRAEIIALEIMPDHDFNDHQDGYGELTYMYLDDVSVTVP